MIENLMKYIFISLMFVPAVSNAWVIDFNFDAGVKGVQVTEFSDAAGGTVYEKNVVHAGKGSAKLTIKEGSDGWGFWGGRKVFPATLGEGDEVWVKVSTFIPEDFDLKTDFSLKFLRLNVVSDVGEHLGYTDIYINNDGTYKYQNELYTTSRLNFKTISGKYIVGESIVGSKSGAEAVVAALKPTGVVFEYTNKSKFSRYENVKGLKSKSIALVDRVETNSVTNFGSDDRVVKGVWETYIYHVKYSVTDPLARFYKYVGGSYKLLFEETTDFTLKSSTDQVRAFLLFTYWNGSAPKTQSMYVDDLQISTKPPLELQVPSAPTNIRVN